MTMHLNGGSKFSELRYEILADDKPTGISRTTRTDGSPRYLKTVDVFYLGEDYFDVLATKGVGLLDWLRARIDALEAAKGATTDV